MLWVSYIFLCHLQALEPLQIWDKMPDPVDSPGSSGSSFDPYTTPGHDTSNRTTEHNHSNHGYQSLQTGHGQRGSLADSDLMGRYRPGKLEEPSKDPDEMLRKRKRSPGADVSSFPGMVKHGSDARGRVGTDFPEGRKRARPSGSSDSKSMSPDGMNSGLSDKSSFPGELWQHIFTFLPPESLGSLLLVNRAFNFLLTADDEQILARSPSEGVLKYQSVNPIWSISRKSFHPGMPRPLFNMKELEMWQLVRGSICQFCGKSGSLASSTDLPLVDKNQPTDVTVVWPFGVRSCGECLKQKTEKVRGISFYNDG